MYLLLPIDSVGGLKYRRTVVIEGMQMDPRPSSHSGSTNREEREVQDQLLSERIQIERKQFFFDLKENPQGRFLKITEDVGGRRNTIIIPSTGLTEFRDSVDHAIQADAENGNTVSA